jgi:uncharacterized protein YjbI with pentapeptide repeats
MVQAMQAPAPWFKRLLIGCAVITLGAALLVVIGGAALYAAFDSLLSHTPSETEDERDARERAARSVTDLERLLKTRTCEECQIYGAELAGKDLRGITLRHSVLDGNLRNADLRGAHIDRATLSGDLRGVDLRGAKLFEPAFTPREGLLAGARMDGGDLHTVRFADYTSWNYAILRGANLQDVSFAGHSGPHGRGDPRHPLDAPTGGATMRGVDLRDANLRGSWLRQADLTNADLRGADLTDADLPPAEDIVGAQFEGAIAPDGLPCLAGSVGRCITKKGKQPPWLDRYHRR